MTINDIFAKPTVERAKRHIELSKQLVKLYGDDPQFANDKTESLLKITVIELWLEEQL